MANTLLKIEHLTKSYDGNVILKDFNLSVRKVSERARLS